MIAASCTSSDTAVQAQDFLPEDEYSSLSSTMSEQVDYLDWLFTNQELDMAKMDVQNLSMELKKKDTKLREMQHRLDMEKNTVSKLELERDLADAESKLVRKQIKDILQSYSMPSSQDEKMMTDYDPFHYVVAHQFVPFPIHPRHGDSSSKFKKQQDEDEHEIMMTHPSALEAKLLEGWQHQEQLIHLVSEYFNEQHGSVSTEQQQELNDERTRCSLKGFPCLSFKKIWAGTFVPSFLSCSPRRRRLFISFHVISKKKKKKTKKQEKKRFRLLNQPECKHQYQAITEDDDGTIQHFKKDNDYDDDERTTLSNDDTATVTTTDNHHHFTSPRRLQNTTSSLIRELVSRNESNRQCMEEVRSVLKMQATRIHNLEHELCHRFFYSPPPTSSCSCSDSSSSSSSCSGSSSSNSECQQLFFLHHQHQHHHGE